MSKLALAFTERGVVPDRLVRSGIRRLLQERLGEIGEGDAAAAAAHGEAFVAAMREAPIALVPEKANEQHYEVPAEFFGHVLGRHRKYSSGWWPQGVETLDAAEAAALQATCERAGLADGQHVLELGCGWGSLSLWVAERFPASRITAVSNSHSQRAWIEAEARRRGLVNLQVVTANVVELEPAASGRFDRIVSVEMFEHLRNWPEMFRRVAGWLVPDGRFFMHVFVHRSTPYAFEDRDESDWMARHFFSGGMMPSDDLALRFQDDLRLLSRWRWDGMHYARTAEAWLARMDARRDAVWPILERTYGREQAGLWWMRWRLFFLSCAELFGHDDGQAWWVAHYLFEPRAASR
ncbi:MAG TPA: cyclopropane-fatty-acyl-phospholipid synthase family protein [Caldimonas sp.]|nr:cyclopropane-fatty-acyl-phospholipid synthase family protein [Caldimonas sp.]